jgi:L-cystine transport system permease protein
MTVFQVIRHIIIPQAFMASLPNLCNMLISLLHGSSLAFWISLIEMTGEAKLLLLTI